MTSERSFRGLWLTMSQSRLTHLILLHVHRERTAALDLVQVMRKFVSTTTGKKSHSWKRITFGDPKQCEFYVDYVNFFSFGVLVYLSDLCMRGGFM